MATRRQVVAGAAVIAVLPPGSDPAPYAAAGAAWWRVALAAYATTADLVGVVIGDRPQPGADPAT